MNTFEFKADSVQDTVWYLYWHDNTGTYISYQHCCLLRLLLDSFKALDSLDSFIGSIHWIH